MTPAIHRVAPGEVGLPAWYGAVPTYACTASLDLDVEVTRALAELTRHHRRRPTVVFQAAKRTPYPLLGNPYPRAVLMASLGVAEPGCLRNLLHRLRRDAAMPVGTAPLPPVRRHPADLRDLPALRHRPGDVGRYLTAAVTVTRPPDGTAANLGVYRAYVAGADEVRIFLNPRSDGYRNLCLWQHAGADMPVAMFLGAHPIFAFVGGAATLIDDEPDDYQVAARLLGAVPCVAGDPPVPVDAQYVLRGRLTSRLADEGPFGEFKGYYEPARRTNVLAVDTVEAGTAPFPFIVPGAESGVALSALDSELRLFRALLDDGHEVRSVRYPPEGHGKYLALVESDAPTAALLDAVMRLDRCPKVVLCGCDLREPWAQVAAWPTDVRVYPYHRAGRESGQRVGMLVHTDPHASPVEY